MAGERAQAATARALASLGANPDLGGESSALDIGLLIGGGGGGGGRGGRGPTPSLPKSPSSSSSSSLSTSLSPGHAARLVPRGAASGRASARAASTTTAGVSAAGSRCSPSSVPQGQREPTVLLQGAQAEAGRKALALNLKLQAALRKELKGVEDTLQRNREVLMAAEARLSSKRCVAITTTSDKFRWSRPVQKFLRVGAYPGKDPGRHKEQEAVLRRDQLLPWRTGEVEALSKYIAKNHPEALNRQTAGQHLQATDWMKAALFVDKTVRRNHKRDRVHCMRTGEECRLRWAHVGVFGAEADAPWTKEEDLAIIMQAEQRGGREWVKIAEEVQKMNGGVRRRTPVACLRRYQVALNTNFVRWNKWTDEEDRILHAAVKRYGPRNWLMVARDLPGRTPAQCENKFKHTRKTNPLAAAELLTLADPQQDRPVHGNGNGSGSQEAREDDGALLPGGGGHHDRDLLERERQQRQQRKRQQRQQEQQQQNEQQQQHQQQPQPERRAFEDDFYSNAQPTRGGWWTPNEERRLCLAVRALIPQTNDNKGRPPPPPSGPPTAAGSRVEVGSSASGAGKGKKGKKRPRDTESLPASASASRSDEPGSPQMAPGSRETANPVEYLRGVNWAEVASLMAHTRNEWQCRVKWFEVLDPSVNRSRAWEADEDAQLLKIMKVRRIGEWRAVERDMAEWAGKRGIQWRTDHGCKRRFALLEPEKYEQHKRDTRDRRDVEPRLNAPYYTGHGKTKITFEDFDLVSEEGVDDDDDDVDDDDDDGW